MSKHPSRFDFAGWVNPSGANDSARFSDRDTSKFTPRPRIGTHLYKLEWDMDQPQQLGVGRAGKAVLSRRFYGILLGLSLFGIAWGVGTSTHGAQSRPQVYRRLLATPIRFDELIRSLDDPRAEIRLEAINFLATLNRPASQTVPALRKRFNDPATLVRAHAVRTAIRAGMPVEEGVPVATQLLRADDPDACCIAAQILGNAGPLARDALPQLHACFAAPSVWVRMHTAQAALRIDAADLEAIDCLQATQASEDCKAREFAIKALDDVVNGLIAQLRSPHVEARLAAAIRLEQLGPAAAAARGPLVGRFSDPELLVRAHAARAALRTGAPTPQIVAVASNLLVPGMSHGQLEVLRVAVSILVEIGPDAAPALPRLNRCLASPSIAVRLYAAEAVLRIDPHNMTALNELYLALDSRQTEVRFFAVNALGSAVKFNDWAVFALQGVLADSDPKIATAAALHLTRTHGANSKPQGDAPGIDPNDPDSVPPQVAAWIADLSSGEPTARRTAAIHLAIAGRKGCHSVPALTAALRDPDSVVRLHAAQAIWAIDHDGYAILPVLVDLLLADGAEMRVGAAYALGRMGPAARDTLPWLTKLLYDANAIDRLVVAEVLVQVDPTHRLALDLLVGGLRAADADVRYLSTVALGVAPPARQAEVEQMLRATLADRNFHVRCAAATTLDQIYGHKLAGPDAGPVTLGSGILPASGTSVPRR